MNMGVGRDVFKDSGDFIVVGLIRVEHLSHRIFFSEVLFRHFTGDKNGEGIVQGCFWIACHKGEGKDLQKLRVDHVNV